MPVLAEIETEQRGVVSRDLAKLATWLLKAMVFLTVTSVSWRLKLLFDLPPGERQPYFDDVLLPRLGCLLLYAATLFVLRRWRIAGSAVGTLLLGHHAFQTAAATLTTFAQRATVLAPGVIALGALSLLLWLAAILLAWQGAAWAGIGGTDTRRA
jgi:hypothetical protein